MVKLESPYMIPISYLQDPLIYPRSCSHSNIFYILPLLQQSCAAFTQARKKINLTILQMLQFSFVCFFVPTHYFNWGILRDGKALANKANYCNLKTGLTRAVGLDRLMTSHGGDACLSLGCGIQGKVILQAAK